MLTLLILLLDQTGANLQMTQMRADWSVHLASRYVPVVLVEREEAVYVAATSRILKIDRHSGATRWSVAIPGAGGHATASAWSIGNDIFVAPSGRTRLYVYRESDGRRVASLDFGASRVEGVTAVQGRVLLCVRPLAPPFKPRLFEYLPRNNTVTEAGVQLRSPEASPVIFGGTLYTTSKLANGKYALNWLNLDVQRPITRSLTSFSVPGMAWRIPNGIATSGLDGLSGRYSGKRPKFGATEELMGTAFFEIWLKQGVSRYKRRYSVDRFEPNAPSAFKTLWSVVQHRKEVWLNTGSTPSRLLNGHIRPGRDGVPDQVFVVAGQLYGYALDRVPWQLTIFRQDGGQFLPIGSGTGARIAVAAKGGLLAIRDLRAGHFEIAFYDLTEG